MLLRSSKRLKASFEFPIQDQWERGVKMNELPNELICMVFNHLDIIDLIHNCRLVSKRWLALVDSIKFKELIITDSDDCSESTWYYTLELINHNNLMYVRSPNYSTPIYLAIKYVNFSNLKRLKIELLMVSLDIDQLNQLIQLEHLKLKSYMLKKNSTLCLPNLRILELCLGRSKSVIDADKLVIHAKKLEVLKCWNLPVISLIHPESIKFLELGELDQDLNQFANLEVFTMTVETFVNEDRSLLSKLPNCVKEFHFDTWTYYGPDKDYYRFILQDKVDRRKSNLKIYLNRMELTNELFDSNRSNPNRSNPNRSNPNRLEFYHINYEKLTTLPRLTSIDYLDLMKVFNNVIPSDFFIKFNNIQVVVISVAEMTDQNHLIWFLKGCHHLNKLELIYRKRKQSNLNQEFYNKLPKIASLLSNLTLCGHPIHQIDLKFILEFKFLSKFYSHQQIPSQTAKNLIKKIKFLRSFLFKNRERWVEVSKVPGINKFFIDISVKSLNGSHLNVLIYRKANGNIELDQFLDTKLI